MLDQTGRVETPDNAWDREVTRLAADGPDEEAARAKVLRDYLDRGDPRPLFSGGVLGLVPASFRPRLVAKAIAGGEKYRSAVSRIADEGGVSRATAARPTIRRQP